MPLSPTKLVEAGSSKRSPAVCNSVHFTCDHFSLQFVKLQTLNRRKRFHGGRAARTFGESESMLLVNRRLSKIGMSPNTQRTHVHGDRSCLETQHSVQKDSAGVSQSMCRPDGSPADRGGVVKSGMVRAATF
nr:hypothetical protein CFP56_03699 [Quercus suber]